MSKFPNQLALVSVVGISSIVLAVGFSERAAHKAEEAAHEAEMHAAASEASAVPHGGTVEDSVAVQDAAEQAAETEVETETAEAEPAETVDETAETAAADVEAAEAAPVIGANSDTLEDKPAVASTMVNGHGSTAEIRGSLEGGKFGLGRPALPEELAAWDIDVLPDGTGLPEGSGNAYDGEEIFAEVCAVCHGDFAEGVDNWPKLAGGMDTLDHEDPLKTVGSYWPYLSTTFDYVRRSMPFGDAQSLTNDEVYAIVAYILYSNDLIDDEFELSKETFLEVEMPNAGGFFVDDRAETEYGLFSQEPCMENCKETVEITMRAAVLDVTPDEGGDDAAAAAEPEQVTEVAAAPAAEAPAETAAADEAAPVVAEEAAPAAMAIDPELVAAGEKVFKKCKACHQVGDGAKNRTGPVLNGVIGRSVGGYEGFKFSKVMVEAGAGGMIWDDATLAAYLASPKKFLKGNKMAFAGLKKDADIAAVTAYLKSHP